MNAIATETSNGSTAMTTRTIAVTVNNTAPTASLVNGGPVGEGSTTTVTVLNQADPSPEDVVAGFRYSYDFNNDGDFTDSGEIGGGAVATYANSSTEATVTVPASYLADGPAARTVRARVFDKDGGFVDATTIAINNVAPTATFTATGTFIEGQPITVTFSNQFDPSAADTAAGFRYSYDFNGDGVYEVGNGTSYAGSVSAATQTFTAPPARPITIIGRIFDKDGGFTQYIANGTVIQIANVDIIAVGTGNGGGPIVKVFDGLSGSLLSSFFAYESTFLGGVNVAAGDVDGDGRVEILTGTGVGGGPVLKVFDAITTAQERSFFAFGPDRLSHEILRNGFSVASVDVDNDGLDDIIAGSGANFAPTVFVVKGTTLAEILQLFPYEDTFTGGVYVG